MKGKTNIIELHAAGRTISYDSNVYLSSGGYGTVYPLDKVEGEEPDKFVLKRLKGNVSGSVAKERISEEVRILESIQDLCCVPCLKFSNASDDKPWYVMEKLSPLEPVGFGATVEAIYDIALALNHIHQMGIAHRDIKSDNIMRRGDGTVIICDFSVSVKKDTADALFDFNPPVRRFDTPKELFNKISKVDCPKQDKVKIFQSSDVYMLGYLAYEKLAGKDLERGTFSCQSFCRNVADYLKEEGILDSAVLLYKAISSAIEEDYDKRCCLQTFIDYVDKAMHLDKLTADDKTEIMQIQKDDIIAHTSTEAGEIIYEISKNRDVIDQLLDIILPGALVIYDRIEIATARVKVDCGHITFSFSNTPCLKFSVKKLVIFNRDNYPVLKIEATKSVKNPAGYYFEEDAVLVVFSSSDKERFHHNDRDGVWNKYSLSLH